MLSLRESKADREPTRQKDGQTDDRKIDRLKNRWKIQRHTDRFRLWFATIAVATCYTHYICMLTISIKYTQHVNTGVETNITWAPGPTWHE